MRILFSLLVLLTTVPVSAQRMLAVTPDPDVNRVLDLFARVSEREDKIDGWRVQLLATTDRQQLEKTEREFKANYPSIIIDWVHNKPYYKLRAGAFFTRQEAERLRQRLSTEYEGVYLVKAEVEERELLEMY
ncbi:SPOR domain-containing protein [Neolewinella litorea]|uniref:SPOR domain-containing protein n=1 Tax=Neolewinella litorea TaxID=2562452 RepID=A0A4S4NEH1_9BACT|nr:SPOR domain-containing protein [Neolewinella litorea]THH36508.1 SPOR domain-containing protein [Neolewinella litorea]